MSTIRPDGEHHEDRTILPSASTPEPEYEPGDLIPSPQPITPMPGGSRVNHHGVRRSTGAFSAPSADRPEGQLRTPGRGFGPDQTPQHPHMWAPPSADSRMAPHPHYPAPVTPHPSPMSVIGIVGGGISLIAVILAAVAPFVPFLSIGSMISLWGAETGAANSYIVLAGAAIGFLGGLVLLASSSNRKLGTYGGILSMVAGAVVGGIATYLVTNADHRAIIAQGGSFGAAAWLLIAAAGGLLVGGILGLVRGSTT